MSLTRDIRQGDEVVTPLGRVARVVKIVDEGDFLILIYADKDFTSKTEEYENSLTLSVRYCRLLQGLHVRTRGNLKK